MLVSSQSLVPFAVGAALGATCAVAVAWAMRAPASASVECPFSASDSKKTSTIATPAATPAPNPTLFERLGGDAAVDKAVVRCQARRLHVTVAFLVDQSWSNADVRVTRHRVLHSLIACAGFVLCACPGRSALAPVLCAHGHVCFLFCLGDSVAVLLFVLCL